MVAAALDKHVMLSSQNVLLFEFGVGTPPHSENNFCTINALRSSPIKTFIYDFVSVVLSLFNFHRKYTKTFYYVFLIESR